MTSVYKSKNDKAWERLFDQYRILDEINARGRFIISSTQINTERESRLMAKVDQFINLPQIFRKNQLSILPVSRSAYIIAPFITHQLVTYSPSLEPIKKSLPPNIQSIDDSDLYSEAVALNCAYLTGMIDDIIGEQSYYTISGRMSTESFHFSIHSTIPGDPASKIDVNNSQCEIDGGFEGEQCFALVEAKNYTVEDFLIRQLYYPYRLWSAKLSKRVIPIFMTFSQDIFDFFIYEFVDEEDYNSLQLIEQKSYTLTPKTISTVDVNAILTQAHIIPEPLSIPFPQADSFKRIVDLLTLLMVKDRLTRDEITEEYQFDARQTNYYTDAARYLGLVDKFIDPDTREITFQLTDEAQNILRQRHKQKYLGLIRKILERVVFNRSFRLWLQQGTIRDDEIGRIIEDSHIPIQGATIGRRARTVRGWIAWIMQQTED